MLSKNEQITVIVSMIHGNHQAEVEQAETVYLSYCCRKPVSFQILRGVHVFLYTCKNFQVTT